jgi:hypothetical protein
MTSIIQTLTDFEELLLIAKRHGLTEFKLGDIAVVMPLSTAEPERPEYVTPRERSLDEMNADIYAATLSI